MKILVLNGPNINMLGIREPGVYDSQSYAELLRLLDVWAGELGIEMDLDQEFSAIENTLAAGTSRDYAASRGEYLNGKLLARIFR